MAKSGIRNFNNTWKFTGQRGEKTRITYEQILFSIWRNHHYFEKHNGFQISIRDKNGKINGVRSKVINKAVEAGLLIIVKNYSTGNHTRIYKKNNILFRQVFGTAYDNWNKSVSKSNRKNNTTEKTKTADNEKSSKEKSNSDIIIPKDDIMQSKIDNINNLDIKKLANLDIKETLKLSKKEIENLNYDIYKLYDLKKKMLPYYYKLMLQLNEAAIDDRLKFTTFLYFDKKGLPSGRPYSYFAGTLNDEKKHDKDDDRQSRKDFLTEIGLDDYIEIYDMKSQVARVNYLYHTGRWKPDSYDFYEEILKNTEAYKNGDEVIIRDIKKIKKWMKGDLTDEELELYYHEEDTMKKIFMRLFFRENKSLKQTFTYYKRDFLKRKIIDKYLFDDIDYPSIKQLQWLDYYCATVKTALPSIDNLNFWFCFFLETELKIELLNRGKKVYNIYDAFYYHEKLKDETKAEIIQILSVKAVEIYEKWMKPIHKPRAIIAGRINKPCNEIQKKRR
jgi:hypothetical protein